MLRYIFITFLAFAFFGITACQDKKAIPAPTPKASVMNSNAQLEIKTLPEVTVTATPSTPKSKGTFVVTPASAP